MAEKKAPPYLRVDYELPDVQAFQLLIKGECPAHLQKRAVDWLINNAAMTYDETFMPEGERETNFAQGRRFVGLQVVKMTKLDTEKLKKGDK